MNMKDNSCGGSFARISRRRRFIYGVIFVVVLAGLLVAAVAFLGKSHDGEADWNSAGHKGTLYTCGMHPWVVLPSPGLCPICHMELVPLDASKIDRQLVIDPVVVQKIGVRVEPVRRGPLMQIVRTVGTVDYDETKVRDVSPKFTGWIEKLYVDYTGSQVKKDQPLFDISSLELYSTQVDHLISSGIKFNKLEYLGMSKEKVAELERTRMPFLRITTTSPFSGTVVTKDAVEGQMVAAGQRIFRIADLSSVWVFVSLYEYQIPFLKVGQAAEMELPYFPGQKFQGKVTYIYPYLNSELRQVKVRLEFTNPNAADPLLKPGMFANVEIKSTLANERLLAPRNAIIDTGKRQIAFVSLGDGRFDPRQVRLGVEGEDGVVEVLDGLKDGEMVVTNGQFLLDSENNMRESLARMTVDKLALPGRAMAEYRDAGISTDAQNLLADMIGAYIAIGDKLADDRFDGISAESQKVVSALGKVQPADGGPEYFPDNRDALENLSRIAVTLTSAKLDLASARQAYADMTIELGKLLQTVGVPPGVSFEMSEYHCPMYRPGQGGAVWMQKDGDVRNPYFGKSMLECYDRKTLLPKMAALKVPTTSTTLPVMKY